MFFDLGANTATDYHESMNILIKADEMFSELPSSVRLKFNNDPASFLTFVNNPNNLPALAEIYPRA